MEKLWKPGLGFLILFLLFAPLGAEANHGYDGHQGHKGYHDESLKDQFFDQARFLLFSQEDLGLSEDQVKQIWKAKMDAKKQAIRQDAEIEILGLDIKSALMEDQPNLENINKLIDQKFELKKQRDKQFLVALTEVKKVLSEDQQKKVKELRKQFWSKKRQ